MTPIKVSGIETIELEVPRAMGIKRAKQQPVPHTPFNPNVSPAQPSIAPAMPWDQQIHIGDSQIAVPGTPLGPFTTGSPIGNQPYTYIADGANQHHKWEGKLGDIGGIQTHISSPTGCSQYSAETGDSEKFVLGLSESFRNDLKAVIEGRTHNGPVSN